MIKKLWLSFGFWLIVAALAVAAGLAIGIAGRVPESPSVQMDMKKLVLYERTLRADVLFIEFDDAGTEWVWVIWNEDWIEDDRPFRLAQANAPMIIRVLEPRNGIIKGSAGIEYAEIYYIVWHLEFIEEFSSTFLGVPLERPDAVDWDWGRH